MQLYFIESVLVLIVFTAILSGVLGIGAFVADHWDASGKTFTSWMLTGFPSPWRYARRLYWRKVFSNLNGRLRALTKFLDIDPETLILKGKL